MMKMRANPLVSVVIVFWNAQRHLREAIQSVFAQSYHEWELLLVDDGSTDGSTKIALDYVRRWPRKVRYLAHPGHENHGISASRNLGVAHSRGEYVAFLDSDDVWLPRKLLTQVAILQAHSEAALVCEPVLFWHSWELGKHAGKDVVQKLGVPSNSLIKSPRLVKSFLQNDERLPCVCSVLFRRSAIDRFGGYIDSFRGMYEDQVLLAKICLRAPVFVGKEFLSKNRLHPDSVSSAATKTGVYHSARLTFLRWLGAYMSASGVSDREVWRILNNELWAYRHSTLRHGLGLMMKAFGRILPDEVKSKVRLSLLPRLHMPTSVAVSEL